MFDELLAAWAKAFGEMKLLKDYRNATVVLKHATDGCFDLESYSAGSFPAGNSLSDEAPLGAWVRYEYGLGSDGLPCFCQTVQKALVYYAGFYRYSADVVEFVEYNLSSGVPHLFQRMVFEN